MITEEKIKEVQQLLKNGEPQGELHNKLIEQGYSEEDLKKVFVPHKYDMRSWYLISTIVLFIAGVYFFSMLLIAGSAILFSFYFTEKKRVKGENLL